jgi:hypothetical protein
MEEMGAPAAEEMHHEAKSEQMRSTRVRLARHAKANETRLPRYYCISHGK